MLEEPIKLFFSYSRKDLDLRNALEDHLAALREAGKISTWHDLELEAGTEWEPAILNKLDTADIILLLISSHFIASKYCYGTELKRAIDRHNAGTARVIPIILRPCDWNHPYVPFSKLNVLPTHATPITKWEDPDEAFTIVAQKIRETVEQLRAEKQAKQQAAEQERRQQERRQAEAAEQQRRQQERRQAEAAEQQRREAAQRQQTAQTQLASEKGVDYSRLRDLLKAGKWEEADRETADRMREVMGKMGRGNYLLNEDIRNFPCTDLCTIDHLWVTYSLGKFGFSVQKKIWQECGSPTEYNSNWEKFGDRVGWRNEAGRWIPIDHDRGGRPDLEAYFPHMPLWFFFRFSVGEYAFSSLASRLVDCNIS